MAVVKQLHEKTKDKFDKAGIDAPAFNSLCLIEKAFGVSQTDLLADGTQTVADTAEFDKLVERRLSGEPLQYILGEWEFYGYPLKIGEGVLIPRDDTEVLLRACLELLKHRRGVRALDLCSGSGALAVAIAGETDAEVYAVEKSDKALPYLYDNIRLNNVNIKVTEGDIFECHKDFEDGFFDLILSNPPYIRSDEIKTLQKEVGFEPEMALDGGADGYDFYRAIIGKWSSKLRQNGVMAFELGEGQLETVKELMKLRGFTEIHSEQDFSGIHRAVYGTLNSN